MGKLDYKSGLPEDKKANYFKDITSDWIKEIENEKCVAVIGIFPSITDNKFIDALIKKHVGIVLSDSGYSCRIITKSLKRDHFNSDEEYKGIRLSHLRGIPEKYKDILNKTTNVEGEAFRFFLRDQIVNNQENSSLHAKVLGLVDKQGCVYKILTGGHNPTYNGNISIDTYTTVTDPKEIDRHIHIWVCLWIESVQLDRAKSPDLMDAVKKNWKENKDIKDIIWQALKNASITRSYYVESNQNNLDDYLLTNNYTSSTHKYLDSIQIRKHIKEISDQHNVPIGVKEEYLSDFIKRKNMKITNFFTLSEKPENTLVFADNTKKVYLHKLLIPNFLKWLDDHPQYKKELDSHPKYKLEEHKRLEERVRVVEELVEELLGLGTIGNDVPLEERVRVLEERLGTIASGGTS